MKKKYFKSTIASVLLLSLPILSSAEFIGKNSQSNNPVMTVKAILDHAKDEQQITLTGNIAEKIKHEKYLFTDGTASIRLEIDDKKFPATPINEMTTIKIFGEFESDFLESPEIDVDYIEIIN